MPLFGSLLLFSELESLLYARPCDESFIIVLNHSTLYSWYYFYSHCIEEEVEVQRG